MSHETTGSGRIVWLAVMALLFMLCSAWGKVIYVDDDATAPGDGTSWATAYRFLQDALGEAARGEKPVEIRVAQGLYKPDRSWFSPEGTGDDDAGFKLFDDMSLLGGYAGLGGADPNARDFEAYETILSGDLASNDVEVTDVALLRKEPTRDENTWVVVPIRGDSVLLEGVTITGAICSGVKATRGTSDTIVRNCRFHGNRGDEGDANLSGGALSSSCENLLVERCSFVGNAGDKGAVICRSHGDFEDCCFAGNYGWGWGGGAGVLGDEVGAFTDCVFENNRTKNNGGALYSYRGECMLTRCVFRGNVAGKQGGGSM